MLALWIDRIFIEGLKYVLIGHFLFGYEFRQDNKKFAILLYPLLIPAAEYFELNLFWFLWGIWLILCLFKIGFKDCVKSFLVMFFLISIVDIGIYIIMVGFFSVNVTLEYNWFKLSIDMIGGAFWIIFSIKGNKLQTKYRKYWNSISMSMYILIVCSMVIAICLLGGLQGYLYHIIDRKLEKLTLTTGIMVVFVLMVLIIRLVSAKEEKIKIEEREKYLTKYVDLQRIHIERLVKKSEDMRGFRHDIKRHFLIMQKYCDNGDLEKVHDYLRNLQEIQAKHTELYFGNVVIDCLVNQVVEELREQGELLLETDGKMPKELFIEDTDISILLGNALENAKEALEKVEFGKRFLKIEIRHYQNWLYFNIQNSVKDGSVIDFKTTSKENSEIHGFGIHNMKKIVEKYSGSITWNIENISNSFGNIYIVVVKIKLSLVSDECV